MAGADELCDLLFLWLKKRKQCAEKLLALAKELEDVHKKSTVTQVVGSATSVVALSTAGVITLLTGGLATPLLVATTVGTIAGAAVDIASTAIEAIISGSTMTDAKNLIQEDEKIGKKIQEAIKNLKKICGEQYGPTDVDYEVASQIMRALARRNNVDVPSALLRFFVRSMFNEDINGPNAATAIHKMVILSALTLLFQLGITGLEVGAKGLGKSAAYIGAKGAAKAATKAGFKLLGVVGFGVSLYSLVSNCEEMLKSNQGTEASQALRDAAREIQEARSNLKEQLNSMNEIVKKMSELKNLIKSVGKYSLSMTETGQKIIDYVIQSWSDEVKVVSWLKTLLHKIQFINLLRFFDQRLDQLPDRLKRNRGGHIDIVIVAHGEITNVFMPARLLMPTPTIIDTVLYSPWNCLIDAYAACAIAEGWHNTEGRYFSNPNHTDPFEPNPLPNYWNHMQRSFHPVPEILLTPVYPEEPVWKMFLGLWEDMDRDGRVIIPYLVPKDYVEVFGKMPFFMFIIALSYILMINEETATMHLAACLGRNSKEMPLEWRAQYAYTYDQTSMTDRNKAFMNSSLFRAFRAMFKTNSS